MSRYSIAVAGQQAKSYNPHQEVFLLNIRLTDLENHVNSTLPTLATKDDLRKVEDALRADIKEEAEKLDSKIEKLDSKIEKLDSKIETVRTDVEKVRAEIKDANSKVLDKQSENIKWLLMAVIAIIGTIIGAASYFSGKDVQVVYVPQQPTVSTVEPSVNTISELEELRNRLDEAERANAVAQPSD